MIISHLKPAKTLSAKRKCVPVSLLPVSLSACQGEKRHKPLLKRKKEANGEQICTNKKHKESIHLSSPYNEIKYSCA